MTDAVRVVLNGGAKTAHDQMLAELRLDDKISINSSKLVNWIITDYFERLFLQRKERIAKVHFNERKCLQEAMKIENPAERVRAMLELARSIEAREKPSGRRAPEADKSTLE